MLSKILNYMPGMAYRYLNDGNQRFTYISNGSKSLTGYSSEELLTNSFLLESLFEQAVCFSAHSELREDQSLRRNYRIRCKGNEIKLVEDISIGIFDKNGQLIEVEGFITEIKEEAECQNHLNTSRLYESVFDNIEMDIAVLDEDNRYCLISKPSVKNDQLREWLIGKTDLEYCLKRNKDQKLAEARIEKYEIARKTQQRLEWIEEISSKDGHKRYILRTLKPYLDKKNTPYLVGYGIDISRSKDAEKDLQRREKLLSFSHSLAKIGYWAIYPETEKAEWSDGIYEILELEKCKQKPSLRFYFTLLHPDDVQQYKQHILDVNRQNKAYSVEYRIITPTGKVKYIIEHSPGNVTEEDDNGYFRFGVIQDITEMRQSQEALAESEKHFKAITENSPIAIIEVDKDYKVRYSNKGGSLRNENIGERSIFDYVDEEYHSLLKQTLKTVVKKGTVKDLNLKGGGNKSDWYNVTVGPIKDNNNKVESLILLAADITQQKKHQEDRERLIKEINHKYNDLMQFNYIVSHNLRAPVANLLGISNLLDMDMEDDERKQMNEYVKYSAEAIDSVILDLNNVLSSRSTINEKIEACSLTEIIRTVTQNLKKPIFESKAKIDVDIDSASDKINSIKGYLESIIYNLVSNSIKFRSSEKDTVVNISAVKHNNCTTIRVSDNGIGLDLKAHKRNLFGLYKRFHTHIEGKGLGLHMTKIQVEAIGGSIDVESEVDKGTTFTIMLEMD